MRKVWPSGDPVAEKAQQDPYCFWFLTGVTSSSPSSTGGIRGGILQLARGCEYRPFSPNARSRCTLLRIPRTPCRRVHSFQESSPTCRRGHCVLGPSSCSPSRRCGGGALPCPWSTASRAFSSTAPTRQCRRMQFLKIPSIVPKGKLSCFWKKD